MTIKCEVIQDLLPSYMENITSSESKKLVENHIKECESCLAIVEEMKKGIPSGEMTPPAPTENNERKLVKRIKGRLVTVIVTLVITFSFLGFIIGAFGNVIFQEGNPMPVFSSILKLKFQEEEYVQFSSTPERYMSEFDSGENRYSTLFDFMKEKGWEYKEQLGSGFIFERNGEQMIVETRQYTKNYYIWDMPMQETREDE